MVHVPVFLGCAFRPMNHVYTKAEIEAVIEDACVTAHTSAMGRGYDVEFHLESYLDDYGEELNRQLREKIRNCRIIVIESTEKNLNVFYELGLAHAMGKQTILLQHQDAGVRLPSDLSGALVLTYKAIGDIRGRLAKAFTQYVDDLVKEQEECDEPLRRLWRLSPLEEQIINIVGPDTHRRAQLPEELAPNFGLMEFVGDKDSMVEVCIHLARMFPRATLVKYAASQLPRQAKAEPLVLIGGPLSDEGVGGNSLVADLMKYWKIPLEYSADCNSVHIDGVKYETEYDDEGRLVADYGVIMRVASPWRGDSRVLAIHGIHTYGVLGATQALTFGEPGLSNAKIIGEVCGPDPLFYGWCRIAVVRGSSLAARIRKHDVRKIAE